jgi:hypothetical protein
VNRAYALKQAGRLIIATVEDGRHAEHADLSRLDQRPCLHPLEHIRTTLPFPRKHAIGGM